MGFTRENLRDIRNRIEGAIHLELAEFKGLKAELGRIRFSSGKFSVRLEVTIPEGEKQQSDVTKIHLKNVGLPTEPFVSDGITYHFVDWVPRRHRYPVSYTMNGKRFKCSLNLALKMVPKPTGVEGMEVSAQ